jgi:hypothetical protein
MSTCSKELSQTRVRRANEGAKRYRNGGERIAKIVLEKEEVAIGSGASDRSNCGVTLREA